ncbi:hypothetical protein RDI58_001949 [Solanum bulbocastanum]|uniref:Short-chain alcohol dehydrogenase n=1 Tax=Solanum bulbocastanum TaxID=147425 RepID=A0AAN8YQE1_SOLBU
MTDPRQYFPNYRRPFSDSSTSQTLPPRRYEDLPLQAHRPRPLSAGTLSPTGTFPHLSAIRIGDSSSKQSDAMAGTPPLTQCFVHPNVSPSSTARPSATPDDEIPALAPGKKDKLVESIGADSASYRHCDVTDEKQVEDTVAYTVEKYGILDIIFSNVGTLNFCGVLDMDVMAFNETMAINIRGSALVVRHADRFMVDKKIRGSIIFVGIVKAAAWELGGHGIRVNGVSPYGIATPLVCKAYGLDAGPLEAAIYGNGNLKGVKLSTMHVAQSALFLASDEPAYTSGQNLAVDGGLSSILKLQ